MPDGEPPTPVESPCVGICEIDPSSGYCLGCRRTLDEIAGWLGMSAGERAQVGKTLELREVPDRAV